MLIGAHESISGGVELSIERAGEDGCEVVQIFSGSPNRWSVPPIEDSTAAFFREKVKESGIASILVHGSYLVNPASPDPDLWSRSLSATVSEYHRCAALGADYLVVHPGSHRGAGLEEGIRKAANFFSRVLEEVSASFLPGDPIILLENTAGSGNVLGGEFRELAMIRKGIMADDRVGYCFDTAHAFAAGYDLSTPAKIAESLDRIDREAGLDVIGAFHLNDSEKPLGSNIDRHARIGEGLLGQVPFECLLQYDVFKDSPAVLETKPLPDPEGRYRDQVDLLKKLRGDV